MVPSFYSGYVVALGWISNTLPRPAAKRAAAIALINAISNSSSIYASYMYPDSDAPRFGKLAHFKTFYSRFYILIVFVSSRHGCQLWYCIYGYCSGYDPSLYTRSS